MSRIIPKTIAAGVTFAAAVSLRDMPAPAWALTLILRGQQAHDIPADGDGASHSWGVAGDVTGQWAPGTYVYAVRATDGGDTVDVEVGELRVERDIASIPVGSDVRSSDRIALEAIEAVIAKRATLDQERYRINNRELYRTPIAQLIQLRNYYASRVRREERRKSGRPMFGQQVKVVMRPMQ